MYCMCMKYAKCMHAGPDDEVPLKPLKEINPAADDDHARKKPRVSPFAVTAISFVSGHILHCSL